MELDPVFLSRLQFGFVISFHIIFPAFTIELAAWLATIEGARLATGNPLYRRIFDFWLKIDFLALSLTFPPPLPASKRPDALDHGEQKGGGQPEEQHPVERFQSTHQLPVRLQIQAGVAVGGHRAERVEHRG